MYRTIDWSDVEGAAKEMAGNHQRFDSFAWHDRPADDDKWTIVYTRNRDSRLLEESNAEAIDRELGPLFKSGDIVPEHHGHWACGWIDGYAIRVYDDTGAITPAFRRWCELCEQLADYPVLDEEDYSRREYEATLENIQ